MQFEMLKEKSSIIKVIGVGGGGGNAVNHMYRQGITGVDFIICNTDAQALELSPIPNKVQLGASLPKVWVPVRYPKLVKTQLSKISTI
jgi:cell division protein FtsZ